MLSIKLILREGGSGYHRQSSWVSALLVLEPWVWKATLTLSSSFHILGLNRLHSVISSCFFISNGNLLTPQVIGWWTSAFRSRNSSTSGESDFWLISGEAKANRVFFVCLLYIFIYLLTYNWFTALCYFRCIAKWFHIKIFIIYIEIWLYI